MFPLNPNLFVFRGLRASFSYLITVDFVADEETDEFNYHITRYRPEELHKLASKTKFTRKEIQLMYRGFKQVN